MPYFFASEKNTTIKTLRHTIDGFLLSSVDFFSISVNAILYGPS